MHTLARVRPWRLSPLGAFAHPTVALLWAVGALLVALGLGLRAPAPAFAGFGAGVFLFGHVAARVGAALSRRWRGSLGFSVAASGVHDDELTLSLSYRDTRPTDAHVGAM